MSKRYDMIVIGAGISGLAMAFEAKQAGLNVLVLEKEGRAGGCFDSVVAEQDKSFWLEMGTHTCFNSYGRLLKILDQLGLMDQLTAREKLRYRMYADNKLCSIPARLSFVELMLNAWRIFRLKKDGLSIATYYRAIVGPKNYANVFRHAFSAVICQQADDAPADMLFRKRPRDKSVMRSFTFPEGLARIITELEQQLEVRKGQLIDDIRYDEDGFEVDVEGATYAAEKLVCATQVMAASRLLKESFPDISEQLSRVNEVEIESLGIVVKKGDLPLEPVAGIIAADGDFYSAVARDYVDHPQLRGFAFHFKPGLLDEDQKINHVCELLKVEKSKFVQCFHKTNRLPAPDMGHHQLIAGVDNLLANKPLSLIGNYFAGVAVEDCLERVEQEFSRLSSQ
ncbi:oxygen-dependent protoporphyrinogen oxidase [Mariprofundus micogutta]|uniref:Oxygen-dependent protoporphyrinogen oxidase n=1 Tax=Mariprofundus micogutta TaxID=1921010 RepID=A0A1L8CMF9_9PROT|nr:FAD-dependent oxidoreductase [Mariprofundus micogutta]GAV20084.1 oxygen-dependent protoporphyrinogen oxidase [Mariprofundus micogutta]